MAPKNLILIVKAPIVLEFRAYRCTFPDLIARMQEKGWAYY